MLLFLAQTGAEVGMALVDNPRSGINWVLFCKTFTAWIMALIFGGLVSSFFFSIGERTLGKQDVCFLLAAEL